MPYPGARKPSSPPITSRTGMPSIRPPKLTETPASGQSPYAKPARPWYTSVPDSRLAGAVGVNVTSVAVCGPAWRASGLRLASAPGPRPRGPSPVLEFWYEPPGCALTDEELELLRRIAAASEPVIFQPEESTRPAHLAFDHRVDVLRDLRPVDSLSSSLCEPGRLA
jgi:hypothetical protein